MITTRRAHHPRLAVAVAAILTITVACSDDDDPQNAAVDSRADDTTEADADPTNTEPGTTGDEDTEDGEEEEDSEADDDGASDEPPDGVLATAEGPAPFGELEIVDLRRVGDTVTVEFVIVITGGTNSVVFTDIFSDPADHGTDGSESASGVTLVDKTNNQRHLVLRDSQGACLCTDFGGRNQFSIEEGERFPASAEFPAPPDDVTEMSVDVPHFPTVDSVPLREG